VKQKFCASSWLITETNVGSKVSVRMFSELEGSGGTYFVKQFEALFRAFPGAELEETK